tara:strand:+ start:76 stop:516 length:441 start_codon:yes stop_codon:yes gene_type:complete
MSDKEMDEINKLRADEIKSATALASGIKKNPDYKDRQNAMKIVQNLGLSGRKASETIPMGSPKKVIKGKNIPGGLFNKGGMKKARKAKRGGIEGGKVINETKIVEIPTPDTASFVARRTTLGGPASALKKAIGVFPFVGSGFKKGK